MSDFKFPSIKETYNGEEITHGDVFVFEKVDGANVSIRKEGRNIIPWSRGGPIGRAGKYYFDAFRNFVFNELAADSSLYDLPEELILFGEFTHYGYGHITYKPEHMNKMHQIGMYDIKDNKFLRPEETLFWITLLNLDQKLPQVPFLHHGNLSASLASSLLHRPSRLYSGPREGIVIHEYGPQFADGLRMRKMYHPEFQEVDETKKGADRYLTLKRFVKAGQKILGEKRKISLEALLTEVVNDVHQQSSLRKAAITDATEKYREMVAKEVLPLFWDKK